MANLALILGFIGTSARLGMRGPIIELLISLAIARMWTPRPVRRGEAVRVAAVIAVLFLFISAMRMDLATGFGLRSEQVDASLNEGTNPDAPTEFDLVFANHAEIVRLAGRALPFRRGETYLDLPLQMVPRQIVPDKPLQLSAWWIRYVDPEAADAGAGRAFGSFAEGYLNFGAVGAVGQICFVTFVLLLMLPILRSPRAGMAAAAAQVFAHAYYAHRSELLNLAFVARNAFLTGLFILVISETLRVLQSQAADGGVGVPLGENPDRALTDALASSSRRRHVGVESAATAWHQRRRWIAGTSQSSSILRSRRA